MLCYFAPTSPILRAHQMFLPWVMGCIVLSKHVIMSLYYSVVCAVAMWSVYRDWLINQSIESVWYKVRGSCEQDSVASNVSITVCRLLKFYMKLIKWINGTACRVFTQSVSHSLGELLSHSSDSQSLSVSLSLSRSVNESPNVSRSVSRSASH
jgi:hypothetical protein